MDDKHIIDLLFARAEEALEALGRRFGAGLLRMAKQILTSLQDAEEAVSDTYLALWNAIPPARPDPLTPYVYRVCRNTSLNRLRQKTAQKRSAYEISLDELSQLLPGPSLEETVDARALGRALDAFLAKQNRTSRIIFLRRYWFGDSVKDIAGLLDMKETAVSVRLLRTREKLKDYLIEEGFYYGS